MNSEPDPSRNDCSDSQSAHAKRDAGEDASAPGGSGRTHSSQTSSKFLHPSFIPASSETSRVATSVHSPEPHRGWHSRGYLPHWDHPGMIQAITFRLADSLPQQVLHRWREQLSSLSQTQHASQLAHKIADYLDAGHGICVLRDSRVGGLVENALLHFDGQRYRMFAWCVMPNHVHTLIETREGFPLASVVHSWKSFVAHKVNRTFGRTGTLWQREYHDRYIRSAEHCQDAVRYIENNPVKAGLAVLPHEWPLSSARFRLRSG